MSDSEPESANPHPQVPLEGVVTDVVKRIRDQPFLFVIAIAALIVGLSLSGSELGTSNFRFAVAVIAVLAFVAMVGYYVLAVLKLRGNPAQDGPQPRPSHVEPADPQPAAVGESVAPESDEPADPSSPSDKVEEESAQPNIDWPNMTFGEKAPLIEGILACPSMNQRQRRDTVVSNLPSQIRNSINRRSDSRSDVDEIVATCTSFPNGLDQLLKIIRHYDKGTIALSKLEAVLADMMRL